MRPSIALEQHRAVIRGIVEAHRCKNPRVFGSVLHGADTDESDLDLLLEATPETTLFDISAIRLELTELLKIRVQVVTLGALPEKWRQQVLDEARPV